MSAARLFRIVTPSPPAGHADLIVVCRSPTFAIKTF
jgi:hypothetical protein